MKTLTKLALAAVLGTATFTAQAAGHDERAMTVCTAEIQAYFGAGTEVSLVSRQQGLYGSRLKVAARLDADNSTFASCWVERDSVVEIAADEQQEMLAATVEAEPVLVSQ